MSENEKRQERMSIPSLTCGTQKLWEVATWAHQESALDPLQREATNDARERSVVLILCTLGWEASRRETFILPAGI